MAYETTYTTARSSADICAITDMSVFVTQVGEKLLCELGETGYLCLPSLRLWAPGATQFAQVVALSSHGFWVVTPGMLCHLIASVLPVFCKAAFHSTSWQVAKHVAAPYPIALWPPTTETWMASKSVWRVTGCFAALQRSDRFVDPFRLGTGGAWVLSFQLEWCQEPFRDGGEIFFFFLALHILVWRENF